MKNARWLSLSAFALVSALTTVAAVGRPVFTAPESKLSPKSQAALKALEAQLQRRFHIVDNIDFGYGRVIRTDGRMHTGPTTLKYTDPLKDPNNAISGIRGGFGIDPKRRTFMIAENDIEKKAIEDLSADLDGVAIYTYGLFDFGRMEVRAKGPAYLSKESAEAPKAADLTARVQAVWKTGADSADVLSEDGWTLHVRKVKATIRECIDCHRKVYEREGEIKEAPRALGDPIGVLVIATRTKAKTVAGTLH